MGNCFFERYAELCKSNGETPNSVAKLIGASSGSVTAWKNGTEPRYSTVVKIADHFCVSTDYLLGKEEKPLVNNDEELTEYLEELKNRDEMRMLFSVTKNCTKEEVEQAVRIIEALRKQNDDT